MSRPLSSALALLTAALLYSSFGVLTRIIGFDLPIFFASFTRNLIGTAILLLPLFIFKRFKPVNKADWLWLTLRTGGGILGFLGSYYAFYYLPIGTAYFIFYGGSTIMGFLLGRLFFAEKIELLEGLALSLSIGGLMMIYSLGSIDWQLINYVFLALLGGVGTAVWNVFSKKVSGNYSATQLNGLDFALFTILTLVVSLLKQEQWLRPEFNTTWLANLLFALIFVCTGQLVIHGFKYLDSQKGSLIMLLEIVFGVIVGLLAYQEALGLGAIAGGTLILVGAALPNLPVLRKQKFS